MELIDFHTHAFPDPIAEKGSSSIGQFYHLPGDGLQGDIHTLLSREAAAGVTESVLLPVAIKPGHVRHINEFSREQADLHSRIIPFGTVHAGMADPCAEAEYLFRSGFRGIKIHPDMQHFAIDDLRLYPMYDYLQGRLPILFHMGDAVLNYSYPIRLRRILDLFPGLTCIAAHLGGFTMYETAGEFLRDTNCFLDVSSVTRLIPDEQTVALIRSYGAQRCVFGTDFPLWDPVKEVKAFYGLKLSDREFEEISWKTAHRILGRT